MSADSTTGIALISLGFIVGGYFVLAGLFYVIVYRPARSERRARGSQADRARGDGDIDPPPEGK